MSTCASSQSPIFAVPAKSSVKFAVARLAGGVDENAIVYPSATSARVASIPPCTVPRALQCFASTRRPTTRSTPSPRQYRGLIKSITGLVRNNDRNSRGISILLRSSSRMAGSFWPLPPDDAVRLHWLAALRRELCEPVARLQQGLTRALSPPTDISAFDGRDYEPREGASARTAAHGQVARDNGLPRRHDVRHNRPQFHDIILNVESHCAGGAALLKVALFESARYQAKERAHFFCGMFFRSKRLLECHGYAIAVELKRLSGKLQLASREIVVHRALRSLAVGENLIDSGPAQT